MNTARPPFLASIVPFGICIDDFYFPVNTQTTMFSFCMYVLSLSIDKTVISAFRLIPAHLVRKDETQTLPECMGSLVQLHISYTTHN